MYIAILTGAAEHQKGTQIHPKSPHLATIWAQKAPFGSEIGDTGAIYGVYVVYAAYAAYPGGSGILSSESGGGDQGGFWALSAITYCRQLTSYHLIADQLSPYC